MLTRVRGRREAIFWQTARTAKLARPAVSLPTARAGGLTDLPIVVDSHERYAWKFTHQQATTSRRALSAGDYAVELAASLQEAAAHDSSEGRVAELASGTPPTVAQLRQWARAEGIAVFVPGATGAVGSAGSVGKVQQVVQDLGFGGGRDRLAAAGRAGRGVRDHLGLQRHRAGPGPRHLVRLTQTRGTISGFLAGDHGDLAGEYAEWIASGRLASRETFVDGIEQAVDAFLGALHGANPGKMLVRL